MILVSKVISGGQTGADRGALEAAKTLGLATGGFMPEGFRAEDGNHPEFAELYGMIQTVSSSYPPRTMMNVEASDGTFIFGNLASPGSKLTRQFCDQKKKPWCQVIWPSTKEAQVHHLSYFREWLEQKQIKTLNVAGNREEKNPGITKAVGEFLLLALK